MKILIFWDVYGRIGRNALKKELPKLKEKYSPDFIITNVDNITSGRWAIEKHLIEMEKLGVDAMTGWDHIFDNYKKVKDYLEKPNSKLVRFANLYDEDFSGVWYKIFEKNGKKLLLIHLQWEIFMNHKVKNPFREAEKIIKKFENEKLDAIVIDFHRETTSEIYGMAYILEWKASFVYGTHTHIQTNDEIILDNGTWILTDVGMNWALKSVIWATFESVKGRFLNGINKWKIEQSLDKNYLVSAVFVEIWENKKCEKIEKIRIRGEL